MGSLRIAVDVISGEDPPVVLVAARGTEGASWQPMIGLLVTGPTVVSYDRPGVGASDPRPAPNPPVPYSVLADELGALLDALDIAQPVVLAGHSIGGLIVRSFAGRHPHRTAGLVLVDGSVPGITLRPGEGPWADGDGTGATRLDTVAGKAELLGTALPAVPAVVLVRTPGWWPVGWAEPFDPAVDRLWHESAADLALELSAPLVHAADAGHQMMRDAPALVAWALDEVVRAVRDRRPVAPQPDRLAAAGGQLAA